MSSNRLMYDRCAYATEIKESTLETLGVSNLGEKAEALSRTEPLEYNLFLGKFENCKTCPVGDFPNVLPFGPKTMVESELLGLTRENSKCPSKKYQANSGFKDCVPLSAARMCESIYYITRNNLEKPTSNMINSKNLAVNFCPAKNGWGKESMNKIVERFQRPQESEPLKECLANAWNADANKINIDICDCYRKFNGVPSDWLSQCNSEQV